MKSTGHIRKIDNLNRMQLPAEIRRMMNINKKDEIVIFDDIDNESIIIMKLVDRCYFCKTNENLKIFRGKYLCQHCLDDIINKE